MAIGMPFSPTTGATTGNSVKVTANATPTSVNGSVDCTTNRANNILITNNGTVLVFVRASRESPPTATNADLPIPAGQNRLIMNPNPDGKTGVAVLSSAATACDVYFTPGEGGI